MVEFINVLDMYNVLVFQCFRFPHHELLEVINEFSDDLQYLASTRRMPVGGQSCTCVCVCVCSVCVFVCVSVYFIEIVFAIPFSIIFFIVWCGDWKVL